ncbi:membrane protein [Marivirga tractuosa]|uniref:RagB/SusD domain protein n=1 Tax=Marivirga tractuosa (strain ATCC 23168 / DSM 4126 / NBRC 15989 / NCIMB 1408 / VKM B-1430 / H-43) TaxID=643867 RepID=E4TSE7_MARTH|nr:RagB/SusD family nutrient uptake outer membrane protein [Marivirga tractuosa]ADR22864.1 RagB/SusD domain protein [Marivirga tractuosa DSM 4126]BDD16462.1 membrane protein [Marivirga tractuosa]
MKRIIYIFLGILIFSSCDEFLDVTPRDIIVEETAYQSLADIESGAFGVYAAISGTNLVDISSRMGDNLQLGGENRGQGRQTHDYQVVSTTGEALGVWSNLYDVVSRLNRVLSNMDRLITEGVVTEEEVSAIRGEMLAIRAMQHFDLWRVYSGKYDPAAAAVPWLGLEDLDDNGRPDGLDPDVKPERQTTEFIFGKVKEDLQAAKTLLAGQNDNVFRITENAVVALQARVALYEEDFGAAETFASEVLANVSLAGIAEFSSVWTDQSNAGLIFALQRIPGDGRIGTLFTDLNGDRFFQPAQGYIDLFDQVNDVRFNRFVSGSYANDNVEVAKYPGIPDNAALNNVKVFRAAEMQLILAEALAKTNQLPLAADALNELRSERIQGYTDATFSSVDEIMDEILIERRRELGFEGHRWFDLKRNGLDLVRDSRDCTSGAIPCTVESDDFRWLFPIPQAEIFANENIVQNPGYTNNE